MWCWRRSSRHDALATALQDHVKREIAPYKYPRRDRVRRATAEDRNRKNWKRFALRQMAQSASARTAADDFFKFEPEEHAGDIRPKPPRSAWCRIQHPKTF